MNLLFLKPFSNNLWARANNAQFPNQKLNRLIPNSKVNLGPKELEERLH